jgi:type II secretory pathway pseudopilin PulG
MRGRRKLTAMLWARRFKNDRRGSTLIEVIVSVLIVGIAFVPLMVGLNAALKVNKQTENNLNAENVAVNAIEVCKTYGTKGLEKLITDATVDSTKGITTVFSGATLAKNDSNTFTISGIKCGTDDRTYTARVVFEGITDNQNDFSGYPTVEGIQNAIVVSSSEDNFDYVINAFVAQAALQGAEDGPDALSEAEMKKKTNIPKWLSREIYIGIEEVTVDGNTKYAVTKKMVYKANNDQIDGKYPFRSSSYTPTPVVTQEKTAANPVGTYSELPEMIVLTYRQFKDKQGNNLNLGHGDKIIIDKAVTGSTKIYALSENGKTLQGKGYLVSFDASGSVDDQTQVYTNLVSDGAPQYCTELTTFGTASSEMISKMKNITVTITDNNGDVVSKKQSTLIDAT